MKKCKKFYDFEDRMRVFFLGSKLCDGLSLAECQDLCTRICASYNVSPPTVHKAHGNQRPALYCPLDHQIKLPIWAHNSHIVIHETAHAITEELYHESANHGPIFTWIWMELFSRMYDVRIEKIMSFADKHNIKYAEIKFNSQQNTNS